MECLQKIYLKKHKTVRAKLEKKIKHYINVPIISLSQKDYKAYSINIKTREVPELYQKNFNKFKIKEVNVLLEEVRNSDHRKKCNDNLYIFINLTNYLNYKKIDF